MASELMVREPETAVARTDELSEIQRLGKMLTASGYFSDVRDMAQAAVKVLAGKELGIPPIASMMGINIIKGKVALGGNLIASLIRQHGYDYRHKQFDNKACVLEFFGKLDKSGNRESLGVSSFTEEDAKLAGCYGEMYRKFPRNMLYNRAISNGAKWFTPDVFGGAPVYVAEELGAEVDSQGDMVQPAPATKKARKAAAAAVEAEIPEDEIIPDVPETGSREAQLEAQDRKLTEARTQPQPAREERSDKPIVVPRGEKVTDDVVALWKRMGTSMTTWIPELDDLKMQLMAEMGTDAGQQEYYRILREHGAEHKNQIKKVEIARQAAAALYRSWQAARAENRKGANPGIDDSDVPSVIGQGSMFKREPQPQGYPE